MSTKNPPTSSVQAALDQLVGPQSDVVTEDVEVRGVVVTVRGLTRGEAGPIEGLAHDPLELERRLLSTAVVGLNGEPASLSVGQVKAWQNNSPASEMTPVTDAVLRLSGMKADQLKEDVARFPG